MGATYCIINYSVQKAEGRGYDIPILSKHIREVDGFAVQSCGSTGLQSIKFEAGGVEGC